jgi:hypothetical protein
VPRAVVVRLEVRRADQLSERERSDQTAARVASPVFLDG